MIARIIVLLTLCGILCDGVFGLPYSQVYVRSSAESSPIEYVNYGAPAFPLSAPLTAPVVPPCVSPCVLPSGTVAAVAPVTNANIVAYSPPIASRPVVIAPRNDDKSSYEYSYVVYDENTGDHKEQRELSDGSTVNGQYSFIQPDGYVREVKYTADDVKGFNAIIRNYLASNLAEEKKENVKSNELPPCREVKNEALVEAPKEEKQESSETGESKESNEKKVSMESSKEEGGNEKSSKDDDSKETESNESKEKGPKDDKSKEEGSKRESPNEVGSKKGYSKEEGSKEEGSIDESSKVAESQEELKKEEAPEEENSKENKSPTSESESSKSDEKDSSAPESIPGSSEESKDEAARSEESGSSDYTMDIIKCIQAAMEKAKKKSGTYSPLTYIVIPSKPC